jgi:hypothetical protein
MEHGIKAIGVAAMTTVAAITAVTAIATVATVTAIATVAAITAMARRMTPGRSAAAGRKHCCQNDAVHSQDLLFSLDASIPLVGGAIPIQ